MIAKLVNGYPMLCPKQGMDGNGKYHTNLQKYYNLHLIIAASDGYYPVHYTDKPEGNYQSSWVLQNGEILQIWESYTPEPEPMYVDIEKLRADVDYILMMDGLDGDLQ